PPQVRDRLAVPLAAGSLPLASWVAEPRLPGSPLPLPIAPALLADTVNFLAELFTAVSHDAPRSSLADAADVVAAAVPAPQAAAVGALADRLEERLSGLPRGFAHGDFWATNLLVDSGRLTGVVDWSGAGGGRLPLADLLHLVTSEQVSRTERPLGEVVTGWLLPAAQRGALPGVSALCGSLGLALEGAVVRDLAIAYWLEHVAFHLSSYADRAMRPGWLGPNVVEVISSIVDTGL
ncbi:MAG: hypothetical protein AVDCRST_MAG85-1881, partial [uncultured Solirubrobacteraceae bacterium]